MSEELIPVQIAAPAGVVKTESPRASEGRWAEMDKVRFVDTKPEKLGGWTVQTTVAMSGAPRTMHAWRDNFAIEYVSAGTYRKLYVMDRNFTLYDITPIGETGTLGNNPFTTVSASKIVTVADLAHGRAVGDTVIFSGSSAVGGITPSGSYTVTSVPTGGTYTIEHSIAASSGATGGGAAVAYQYELEIGTLYGAYGLGYGVGGYGLGTYGTPRDTSTIFREPRIWSLDHFGQILLVSYNTGTLYDWDPSDVSALTTRAAIVPDAPDDIRYMFVTPERFVLALCEHMTIKWCSQADYATWTVASDNTAGSRGITEGTKLVGGRSLGAQVSLIWSDSALYLHQYTGSTLIFDTRPAGKNCGLISPSASIVVGGTAYWMGHTNFFMYSGSVAPIPNNGDIRTHVFDNLDPSAGYLCAAMYVAKFNEVWFFITTQGVLEPDRYVIVNINDYSWSVGSLTRLSGTFFSHGDTRPYWAGADGHVYLHEDGHDDNGAIMDAYITLAPAGLEKGKRLIDIEGIEPDFTEQDGEIELTVNTWDRIRKFTDPVLDTETFMVAEDDTLLDARTEGRYVGLTIRSNTLGGHFRLGVPTVYIKSDGVRR